MLEAANVTKIGQLIELSLAPVFMLVAIGSFMNVIAGRLSRVVDRARSLEPRILATMGEEHDTLVDEIRLLDKRIRAANMAIFLSVIAALMTTILVVFIFGTALFDTGLSEMIPILFISAILALSASYAAFLAETRIANRQLRLPSKYLKYDRVD